MILEKLFGKKEASHEVCEHEHVSSLQYSEDALESALREQQEAWNDQYESAHSDPKSGKFIQAIARKEAADKKVAALQALKAKKSHSPQKAA